MAGLKFDDLRMEEDPDVAEALRRLSPQQQLARKRRQLRAFDISLKKTPLPDHIQAVQKPFEVLHVVCVFVYFDQNNGGCCVSSGDCRT